MLTDLADVVRTSGLTVVEVPGWRTRGHGSMKAVRGVVLHHTAGGATGDYPSLSVVRDGRAGLAGPLANLGLTRSGKVLVIAAGLAYHAGAGSGFGLPENGANAYMLGIEAESTGSVAGDWTAAQLDAYPRLAAALARGYGFDVGMVVAHKEWAPGRKVDPRGWPGDMAAFRSSVSAVLSGAATASKPVVPAPATPVFHGTPGVHTGRLTADGNFELIDDGIAAEGTIARWQQVMGTPIDGFITQGARSSLTVAVQSLLVARGHSVGKAGIDGRGLYSNTNGPTPKSDTQGALQDFLGTPRDRYLSKPSTAVGVLQRRLNAARAGSGTF